MYAPVWERTQEAKEEREWFASMFVEMGATLDMQVPTILLGDWNGTADPLLDYESGELAERCSRVSPLLAQLLGPGGAWVDAVSLFPAERKFTFRGRGASRCDAMLLNRAVIPLVASFKVREDIRDGGHCPIELGLTPEVVRLEWRAPRPKLPEVLSGSTQELLRRKDLRSCFRSGRTRRNSGSCANATAHSWERRSTGVWIT